MNAHREISKNPERRCFVIFEVTGDALGCHPLPKFLRKSAVCTFSRCQLFLHSSWRQRL